MVEGITLNEFLENCGRFAEHLKKQEKAKNTIKKYLRDLRSFADFARESGESEITKTLVLRYKEKLSTEMKKSSTNTKLISLGIYLKFLDRYDLHAKTFKIQKRTSLDNILSAQEFKVLIETANFYQKKKISAIMQVLACTGIRVSELNFFTKEALAERKIIITNKAKTREIIIPDKIRSLLADYCAENGIESGIIFHGKDRNSLTDKSAIWRSMHKIAKLAGIEAKKVHAHNFRHLFAKTFMKTNGNIFDLADILGHSSIETTRIYTRTTTEEKREQINKIAECFQDERKEFLSQNHGTEIEMKDFYALYLKMKEQIIEFEVILRNFKEKRPELLNK